jgi:hypothetical protein
MRTRIALAATTAALIVPAAAQAAGVVYTDGGNVVVATPDGAVKRQFTTDGTADAPAFPAGAGGLVGPYRMAMADDAGNVVAARNYRNDAGDDDTPAWIHFSPEGKVLHSNLLSMGYCGGLDSIGPLLPSIDPSGTYIAFGYFCNYGVSGGFAIDRRIAINFPDMQTLPANDPPDWNGYDFTSFYGKRMVAVEPNGVWIQPDVPEAPLTTQDFQGWIPAVPEYDVVTFAVNRQGTMAAAVVDAAGEKGIVFFHVPQPIPSGGIPDPFCAVETAANPLELSWSPDGKQLAFNDDGGAKVIGAPTGAGDDGACVVPGPPVVLSATGAGAAFTAYTPAAPGGPSGPTGPAGPTGPTGPTGPGALALDAPLPAKVKARRLRKGVALHVHASAAGTVTVTGSVPRKLARRAGVKHGRVVARGKAAVGAGDGTVKLRLVKAARRRAARLEGGKLKVTLVLQAAGQTVRDTGTIALR